MRRSYLSNSYSKGQWFLISTVMVSAAFLAISFLFEEYFAVDNSAMARIADNYYFDDIKYGLN
ncbi:MAG: hypothetical protein NT129_03970, partial [Candidatus Aenigmarchaeota archaeon]|nr:hypothetical protein [Candidatus Aenigmarchaeota archaeon]